MRDMNSEPQDLESRILELTDTIVDMDIEITRLSDIIASKNWEATEFEKDYILHLVKELRSKIYILEIDNEALKNSRDMFMNRNAELINTVNSLKRKLKA